MLRALAARSLAVLLQKNSTLVVLEQNIVLNVVALGFHEIPGPTDRRHEVISTYNFSFRSTARVELLLGGTHNGESSS